MYCGCICVCACVCSTRAGGPAASIYMWCPHAAHPLDTVSSPIGVAAFAGWDTALWACHREGVCVLPKEDVSVDDTFTHRHIY